MSQYSIVDELKESIIEIFAPEYHRLNLPGERKFLSPVEFELFLSAVVASFLVPFIKKLSEKVAETTWEKFISKSRNKPKPSLPDEEILKNIFQVVIIKTSVEERKIAADVATKEMSKYLDDYGIPREVQDEAQKAISKCIEDICSSKEE